MSSKRTRFNLLLLDEGEYFFNVCRPPTYPPYTCVCATVE